MGGKADPAWPLPGNCPTFARCRCYVRQVGDDHLVAGADDLPSHMVPIDQGRWALWKEFALRATGFPVAGLDAFGTGSAELEEQSLREVARDPRFREAVTWQNRAALRNAIDALAAGRAGASSDGRRRLEIVASYWQRYCAKNDTIGFFGPVGWGHFTGTSGIRQHAGRGLLAKRVVRFETWAVQALADVIAADPAVRPWIPPRRCPDIPRVGLSAAERAVVDACDGRRPAYAIEDQQTLEALLQRGIVELRLRVSPGPHSERQLALLLEGIRDEEARGRALAALAQLESGRTDVANAAGDADALGKALIALESTFIRLTGREPHQRAGVAYGARGVCYEDCQRDLVLEVGQRCQDAIAQALLPVLAASKWYCGEVAQMARQLIADVCTEVRSRSGTAQACAIDVWREVVPAMFRLPSALCGRQRELQTRWASLLEDGVDGLARRCAEAFADFKPAWPMAVHTSPDVQIDAAGPEALDSGEFLVVIGDYHLGINTLMQSFLLEQHPDPDCLRSRWDADLSPPRLYAVPTAAIPRMTTGRMWPGMHLAGDVCLLTAAEACPPGATRTLELADAVFTETETGWMIESLDGSLSAAADEAFQLVTFLMALRTYALFADPDGHAPRCTAGRSVYRRETWMADAAELAWARPRRSARFAEARSWAMALGMPRRVFVSSPVEAKPMYVDFDSPALVGMLGRLMRRTAAAPAAALGGRSVRFTEMLPGPDGCWLQDAAGHRYTSELRVVAVDLTCWPARSTLRQGRA